MRSQPMEKIMDDDEKLEPGDINPDTGEEVPEQPEPDENPYKDEDEEEEEEE